MVKEIDHDFRPFRPYFHDEAAAFAELGAILWPHGPVCPRCGGLDRSTPVKGARMVLRHFGPCKRQFTVTVGTVFEASHALLALWLHAVYLICSSKKGVSSHQLMRTLDVQYKTACFMTHRIREALATGKPPRWAAWAPWSRLMRRSLAPRKAPK